MLAVAAARYAQPAARAVSWAARGFAAIACPALFTLAHARLGVARATIVAIMGAPAQLTADAAEAGFAVAVPVVARAAFGRGAAMWAACMVARLTRERRRAVALAVDARAMAGAVFRAEPQ